MSIHRDVDAELRFHFDARIEALMAEGLSRVEAERRAHDEFGDVDAVRHGLREIDRRVARRRSRLEFFESLWQDVTYAARSLSRSPVLALTIIVTLALGLGANAAMFSLLDVVLVRPPEGLVDPGSVRTVWSVRKFSSGVEFSAGYDYSSYVAVTNAAADDATTTFFRPPWDRKLGLGEHAPRVGVAVAAASYFPFLGVKPQRGRFYSASEDQVNDPRMVAVISDGLWKRQFDGAADIVGRQLLLTGRTYTIVGVAPSGFSGTELNATDVWVPTSTLAATVRGPKPWWQSPGINGFRIFIRTHGSQRDVALEERITTALRSKTVSYGTDTLTVAKLGSINYASGPGALSPELRVATRLAGVAIIVLLIACANVMNLLLARATKRRREIAVRIALGVSRARLMRMLITESVLLAVVATAAALGAAVWGGTALRKLLAPTIHFASTPMHWRVLAFALVTAVIAGVIAGLAPALQSVTPDVATTLKVGARDRVSRRSRLRDALVIIQAAFSVLLLVGAVLFVQSLRNAEAHDVGYSIGRLVFSGVSFDTGDSLRDALFPAQFHALAPKIASLPGVEAVGFTSMRPRVGFAMYTYKPDFDTTGRKIPVGITIFVSPSYFATTGTRLLRGRTFTAADTNSPFEVIVDQTMANALWPHEDPLLHCLYFPKTKDLCVPVVGVAQSTQEEMLTDKLRPHFYLSLEKSPIPEPGVDAVILRVSPTKRAAVMRSLHDILVAEFPGGIPSIETMSDMMEPAYRPWRLGAELFTLFGVLALVVAGVGI